MRVHKNIIIIGDLSEIDMSDWRPIRDLAKLHRRQIGDQHAPLETDMPDQRPIGD